MFINLTINVFMFIVIYALKRVSFFICFNESILNVKFLYFKLWVCLYIFITALNCLFTFVFTFVFLFIFNLFLIFIFI